MLDKAIQGSRGYWTLLAVLIGVAGAGTLTFIFVQLPQGLGVTGLSRDVSWGLYIGQLTFLVGVAASGLMVVLPYYLHDYKAFGRITILGEFLAVGAVVMCMSFVFVDLGVPRRVLNVVLHPTLNSIMFYDFIALGTYLALNLIIGVPLVLAERAGKAPPYPWLKPIIYVSIAWAPLINTVSAFLYAGLPGRPMWLSAIMAVRFLAGAFAAGPALLIVLHAVLKKVSSFDDGGQAPYKKLGQIILYAMIVNLFGLGLEFFTAYYSQIPGSMAPLDYLYFGADGHAELVVFMWASLLMGLGSIGALLVPALRENPKTLIPICAVLFVSAMMEKGYGLIVGGFIPNPLGRIATYAPTLPEIAISLGIYSLGFLIIAVLYKIVVSVREEAAR